MAAQGSAKAPVATTERESAKLIEARQSWSDRWSMWEQVVVAELLVLLEGRRFDLSL